MHTVIVSADSKSAHNRGFSQELGKEIIDPPARVYRTFIGDSARRQQDRDHEYEFVTTSKDVHLSLGLLSREGLVHLARLLDEEFSQFAQLKAKELMLLYRRKTKAVHVTCSEHTNLRTSYVLSPAH